MTHSLRAAFLFAAAFLMIFGTLGYAFVVVPDLHGDLVEIGVRPTVVGGTVLHLYFAGVAMLGFTAIVLAAAIQAWRGGTPATIPLAIIAVTYTVFGAFAFSRSHNPHHLGPLAMGMLIVVALAVPRGRPRRGE
jgi:hypothetical protein